MARDILPWAASIIAASAWLLQLSLVFGHLECEDLTPNECAFAVASSGARCVLEKSVLGSSEEAFPECQTSTIIAGRPIAWIESDECIKDCGLARETYGLSTDALAESGFADKVCSAACQNNCPNIVDLYLKLAAGEGVYLPRLCMESRSRARRLISERLVKYDPRRQKGKTKRGKAPGKRNRLHHDQQQTGQNADSQRSLSSVHSAEYTLGPSPSPWLSKPALQSGGGSLHSASDHLKKPTTESHGGSTSVHESDPVKVDASHVQSVAVSEAAPPEPSYEGSEIEDTADDERPDDEDIYSDIEF